MLHICTHESHADVILTLVYLCVPVQYSAMQRFSSQVLGAYAWKLLEHHPDEIRPIPWDSAHDKVVQFISKGNPDRNLSLYKWSETCPPLPPHLQVAELVDHP